MILLPENWKELPYYKNYVPPEELLPCPFCGSAAESKPIATEFSGPIDDKGYRLGVTIFNYGCSKCWNVARYSKEEWNQRA